MLGINVENFFMNIQLGNITDDMMKKVKDMQYIQIMNLFN